MSTQRYPLENRKDTMHKVQLLYVTCATSDKDWHSMEHSHYFSELFFITGGEGFFRIEGKKIQVKKNDLVLINPHTPHTELGDKARPWEYVALGIEGIQFSSPKKELPYAYSLHSISNENSTLLWYLNTLVKEVRMQQNGYAASCQNLLELILISISRTMKQDFLSAPTQKTSRECRLVEQYINEHYSQNITLEALSSLVHINKYYLVHAFKSYKGLSPINYLIQKRIEEATHLLETTNYPVTKIAEITGFSSQSYFSQTFKKLTGVSPNAYRKQKKP